MLKSKIVVVALITATQPFCSAYAEGDARRGEALYQACQDCHTLDANEVGPMHRGVFGRKAGMVPGYNYSPALRNSNIVWNDETLDRWLTNPSKLVAGTKMFFRLNSAMERADIIQYLKEHAR